MSVKNHIVKFLACASITCVSTSAIAQDGENGYRFLDVPVSAHSAALGGRNISIVEDDASLMFNNAALLSNVSDKSLMLGYTSYIADTQLLSAGFVKAIGERGTWAIGAQVLSYGEMDETDELGHQMGTFTANDINVQTSYSYLLSDRWSGAITAKGIFSNYGEFSSIAIGADLALNYFDEDAGFSFSAVGRNLGGQVKALIDERETLPFNLSMGLSKDFANAPIRVSLTADDLSHWDDVKFIQHFIVGADIFPSKSTWLAFGYNFRRAKEMSVMDKGHGAGWNLGAGINIKKMKVGVAWGKYHVAASSLLLNLSYTL